MFGLALAPVRGIATPRIDASGQSAY